MASKGDAGITICPKCGHARGGDESAPDWQCPACGIAYHGYQLRTRRLKHLITPPQAGDPEPDTAWDGSIWALFIVNVVVLVIAAAGSWDALDLMLAYWVQSLIIGVANFFRILRLEGYGVGSFLIRHRRVHPTVATPALLFGAHYGLFHVAYLWFLVDQDVNILSPGPGFLVGTVAFAMNHFWSYRYNIDMDRQGTPSIGTLTFTPYIRIVPMHLAILAGAVLADSSTTLLLFGGVKTVVDVGMHKVEHGRLKARASGQRH